MKSPFVIDGATEAAKKLDSILVGRPAFGPFGEPSYVGRIVARHEVHPYGNLGLGIVQRWRYADRPDLGEFGGAYLHRDTVRCTLDRSADQGGAQ